MSALDMLTRPDTELEGGQPGGYPYLEKNIDPWGNPYNYGFPSRKLPGGSLPAIWSNGPNGKNEQGEGDDINNWSQRQIEARKQGPS